MKGGLHNTFPCFVKQHVCVGTVSENQRERAHEDGFTRASLAGNHRQPWLKRDFQRADNRIILYLQGG